ncbi:MAG: hypothetical protein RIC07_09580 [Coleofasciculus sp. E1-EBD-02]
MEYSCREATQNDVDQLALLWKSYSEESCRKQSHLKLKVKPDFNFKYFVYNKLCLKFTYLLVIECDKNIAGSMILSVFDESVPDYIPKNISLEYEHLHPFLSERLLNVHAIYLYPEHRELKAITTLVEGAESLAERLMISEINLSIDWGETGLQALVERRGFTKGQVVYKKKCFPIDSYRGKALPSLYRPAFRLRDVVQSLEPMPIALRSLRTGKLAKDSNGKPVFISPLEDKKRGILRTSIGLYVYPRPVLDPQTQDFVFDTKGELVCSPLLRHRNGEIVEHDGSPLFAPPVLEFKKSKKGLFLKKDAEGNCLFHEPELDSEGYVVLDDWGTPIYKRISPSAKQV